jgi:hypothetical protein
VNGGMDHVACLDKEGKDLGEGVMMTTTIGSERLGTFSALRLLGLFARCLGLRLGF